MPNAFVSYVLGVNNTKAIKDCMDDNNNKGLCNRITQYKMDRLVTRRLEFEGRRAQQRLTILVSIWYHVLNAIDRQT